MIEDWQDRKQLKPGVAHSAQDFNDLVVEVARRFREGVREFGRHDLRQYSSVARSSPDRDLDRDLEEILAGQLFEPIAPNANRYRVRPQHVGLALGTLLAREVEDEFRRGGIAAAEGAIARTLDPVSEFDQVGPVLRGACAVAWLQPDYPVKARRALLRVWPLQPNVESEEWKDFAAYLPINPSTIFDLAEDLWGETEDNFPAREWVTNAILRWRELPSVHALMVKRCVRWLGLWHSDWHPMGGRPDPEWLTQRRQAVNQVLSRLTASEQQIARAHLCQAVTPNVPYIARLALLLISNGPRLKYVPGFLAWALSRAIMEREAEFDEVAWCLRMNDIDPGDTEAALLEQLQPLLKAGSDVGARAARHLLWACGTAAAVEQCRYLPKPPGPIPWPPRTAVEVDPLDPAASAPDMTPVMERLSALDMRNIARGMAQTTEDYELSLLEPVLARFSPSSLAEVWRRICASARERDGIRLRQLGWRVPEHLLLIGEGEAQAIDEARSRLLPLLGDTARDAQATEAYLLLGLLPRRRPEDQLDMILARPSSGLDLLLFREVVRPVSADAANARLERIDVNDPSHVLLRLLWILSFKAFHLTERARRTVIGCFEHSEAAVRAFAFRLAIVCGDQEALRHHCSSGWLPRLDDQTVEAFYGSLARIAGADPVDYCALRCRIDPQLLGHLAQQDGKPDAIDAFAQDLDALWETMRVTELSADLSNIVISHAEPSASSTPRPALFSIEPYTEASLRTIQVFGRRPTIGEMDRFFAFNTEGWERERRELRERISQVCREARRTGLHFVGQGMRVDGLAEVAARHPDLIKKWIIGAQSGCPAPKSMYQFYLALCHALIPVHPDSAITLLRCLRETMTGVRVRYSWNIDSVIWEAFHLRDSEKSSLIREEILRGASTDALLFEIVLAALEGNAHQWLESVIRRDLGSRSVFRIARALTLIGFLDEGEMLDSLRARLDGHDGFLGDVAACARGRLARNYRARVWFGEFLKRRGPVEAWAAFRLFLCCVDRRYLVWGKRMLKGIGDLPELWHQHIAVNEQKVQHATEHTEERLSEMLFGLRISKGEIAPWCASPSPAVGNQ